MKNKIVSVIIPTHNGSNFIFRAIESVLRQTYSPIEIIIVDDNGKGTEEQKKTEKVVDLYKTFHHNIKYITYEGNMNGSYARNVGIKNSNGAFIALLDDDDEMLPDKIKSQVECLNRCDKSYVACYTDYRISRGRYIEVSKETLEGHLYFAALSRNLYICGGSNLLIRKNVINKIGGFDESFIRNQDLELLTRMLEYYKIAHVPGCHLIIHMEERGDRRKRFSYKRSNEIDDYYLSKFADKINKLNIDDNIKLHQYFALERFKRSVGTKYIIDALKNLINNHVSLTLFVRYILYLLNRKYTRTIYGFRF